MRSIEIQNVIFPATPELAPLYWSRPDRIKSQSRYSIAINSGTVFCSDSYFNALYEAHWLRWCAISAWGIILNLAGRGTVRVFRYLSPDQESLLLAEEKFDFTVETGLELRFAKDQAATGRIYFEIEASPMHDVEVNNARWTALAERSRPVKLLAGICTFKRDEYLLPNLENLVVDKSAWGALDRLIVVDQGESEKLAGFIAGNDQLQGKVILVSQGNYGGSGGFSRVMIEALSCEGATHLVILDDDAKYEPDSFFRVAAFLALCHDDVTLGGQMLDLGSPMLMHESGADFQPASLMVKARHRDQDLSTTDILHDLAAPSAVSYNAWFFFAFPLSCLRHIGLPLPMFINFDDVEFGLRLSKFGFKSTSIPGIALWHLPGYLKDDTWKTYYYQRNILIINAIHSVQPWNEACKIFRRRLFRHLLKMKWSKAQLACLGTQAFLAGPEKLPPHPASDMTKLRRIVARTPSRHFAWMLAAGTIYCATVTLLNLRSRLTAAALKWNAASIHMQSEAWWKAYLNK